LNASCAARSDDGRRCRAFCRENPMRRTTRGPRSVVQSRQPFGIVSHHGVAQRLPLYAGQPRRLSPAHPLQGVGDRQHPRRRRTIWLAPHQTPQRVRRDVIADRQPSRKHRVPHTWQTQTESDHAAPGKITSESSAMLGGIKERSVAARTWRGNGVLPTLASQGLNRLAGPPAAAPPVPSTVETGDNRPEAVAISRFWSDGCSPTSPLQPIFC
jgi:hypothetical protein